jgi:hypothetical protein
VRALEGLEASIMRQGLIEFGLSFPLAGMAVVLMVKVEPSSWPGPGGGYLPAGLLRLNRSHWSRFSRMWPGFSGLVETTPVWASICKRKAGQRSVRGTTHPSRPKGPEPPAPQIWASREAK